MITAGSQKYEMQDDPLFWRWKNKGIIVGRHTQRKGNPMFRAALITASSLFAAACEGPTGGSAENQTPEFEENFRNQGS